MSSLYIYVTNNAASYSLLGQVPNQQTEKKKHKEFDHLFFVPNQHTEKIKTLSGFWWAFAVIAIKFQSLVLAIKFEHLHTLN